MRTTKDSGAPYHWISLIWVLYPVFLLWVSKIAVKGMDDELKATEEKIFSDPVENILKFETGKNGRFIHLIVDLILTISLLMPFLFVFQYFIPGSDMIRTSKFLFITLLFFQRFIYYGVLESVFKATPAKYLTGSKVVNQHGATNPGFEKIIMRSLFRFIPFEPFSFLGTTGWHDGLSGTFVIKETYEKSGKSSNRLWMLLLFILPVFQFVLGEIKENRTNQERNEFNTRIKQAQLSGIVKHLSSESLIVYGERRSSYMGPLYVFKVDSASIDSVWGYSFTVEKISVNA
ncbi:MAG: RDD family protein [Saprospiraceae bacterium]|uniref:RDD family protein n=1 Tax=Candidatus Opimibacter skivensis TaxID=2982028 RepID=A0A9D7SVD3_9BACT|nr:RDD family protein [Candidatus Opimibacter skivensis]